MRRDVGAQLPNGVMDYLIVRTIMYVADHGGRRVSLNFAFLSSGSDGETVRTVAEAGRLLLLLLLLRMAGTQIESLWRVNSRYEPRGLPRYAAIGAVNEIPRQTLAMLDSEGPRAVPVLRRLLATAATHLPAGPRRPSSPS